MKLSFLWTDQCFLLLFLISTILIFYSARKQHIRRAYRQIFKNPIAVSAAIVLLFFLVIAVLDSIHIKTEQAYRPHSLLDRLLAPLGDELEKTYSAPLALTLYSKETKLINGKPQQVYPRLKYPPASLKNSTDVAQFMKYVFCVSFLSAISFVFICWFALALIRWLSDKKMDFSLDSARFSALLTLFLCFFIIMAAFWISRELHVLGTGKIGQDVFYYAVKSIRTGMVIGTLTTLFMMPLALILGIAAGYFGGLIDDAIQYIYTTLSSIPGVLLITASILSMQTYIANHPDQFATLAQRADARLLALCFILGVTSWTSLCRLLRAESLKLREVDFVLAAQSLGTRSFNIIFKHLLPNVMHIVLITLVLDFSFLVLAEAVLSYVGVGVSPLTISWGNMINAARLELAREPIVWWPMLAAFIFMFILVLASNLFADAVRDAFDPRQAKM